MNASAKIKLIAADMDGTLLNGQKQISRQNIRALKTAAERGIHIAICSGRLCGDISLFALDAGLSHCHILSMNGAYCLDRPCGTPYVEHLLEPEALNACLEILGEHDITYGCFGQNRMVAMVSKNEVKTKYWGTQRGREGAPEYLDGPEALQETIARGVSKIVYLEQRAPERLVAIRSKLLRVPGVEVTASAENNLEVMPLGICKGIAVKELAERLNFSAENVMTIGDYDNDLSMIAYAGYGVAMGNASGAVKAAARYVTKSNLEDGVAEAIQRWAL